MVDIVLSKMVGAAVLEINNPSYRPRSSVRKKSSYLVKRLLGKTARRPSYCYFWTTAIIADGLLEYYKSSGCAVTRNALAGYHRRSRMQAGFREPLYVDEIMNAYTFNALRRLSISGFGDEDVRRFAKFLIERHPKTASGCIPYRQGNRRVLVDTIGMICPFLSEYAIDFESKFAMELAIRQVKEFFERGVSKRSGLPFHGYISESWDALGGEGWGRGVGWLLLGVSSILLRLPKQDADYDYLLNKYVAMLHVVFSRQNSDGSFNEFLIDDASEKDTSATAMIAYSCAKTIEENVIDDCLLPDCMRAYEYIQSQVDSEGRVQGASGEAGGANNYAEVYGWYPWGQGPSIGLGAVIDRIRSSYQARS